MSALRWRRTEYGEYVARAHHAGPTYRIWRGGGGFRVAVDDVEFAGSPYRLKRDAATAADNHCSQRRGTRVTGPNTDDIVGDVAKLLYFQRVYNGRPPEKTPSPDHVWREQRDKPTRDFYVGLAHQFLQMLQDRSLRVAPSGEGGKPS